MSDLSDLIARVEKAEGPDRELDAMIHVALDVREEWMGDSRLVARADGHVALADCGAGYRSDDVTASLDAAITLVERVLPGRDIVLETSEQMTDGRVHRVADATIGEIPYSPDKPVHAYGLSPALALVLALLKAKQAEGGAE